MRILTLDAGEFILTDSAFGGGKESDPLHHFHKVRNVLLAG